MCKYCDYDSADCEIFQDSKTGEWYINHQTSSWDDYDDDWIYDYIYINYCPWCGRKLNQEKKFNSFFDYDNPDFIKKIQDYESENFKENKIGKNITFNSETDFWYHILIGAIEKNIQNKPLTALEKDLLFYFDKVYDEIEDLTKRGVIVN